MATSIVAQSMSVNEDWACAICTYLNKSNSSKCELCLTPRTKNITPTKSIPIKPKKISTNISIPDASPFSRSHSAPKSRNRNQNAFTPQPKSSRSYRQQDNRFKFNYQSKSPKPRTHISKPQRPIAPVAPSTPLDELFEIVPYHINEEKSINSLKKDKSPKQNLTKPVIRNIDTLLSENGKERINNIGIKSPRENLTSLRNNSALKSNLELGNLVTGEQDIMDDILKDMKRSKPPKKALPKLKPKTQNNLSTEVLSPKKFKKKRNNSFLGLVRSPSSHDKNHRRSKSILITKKGKKHTHEKHGKHDKSRNLSNSFYRNKTRNNYTDKYIQDNQITLTKSKTSKKRLSFHKRSSKSDKKGSKPNPFDFPYPPKPNMMSSISLPLDSIDHEKSKNKFANILMQQSGTSPTDTKSVAFSTESNTTQDGFLAAPSRRTTLYKLPAEKHKQPLLKKRVGVGDGNTTSVPSNFSFASHVYAELQAVLKTTRPRTRQSRCSTLKMYEESVQKHESILLEILKFSDDEKKTNDTDEDDDEVIDTIINARCDVLCHFLPLIAFTVCQCNKIEWKMKLLNKLKDRIVGQSDLRQAVRFFIKSYEDITSVRAVFAGLCPTGDIKISESNKEKLAKDAFGFWQNIALMKDLNDDDYFTIGVNTILRDPVRQLSSPIRKVVVRKIINSNSKPLLIDCYALDKSNTEFLSSTCILKYGDDLRKDKSCMLVFKWINHLFLTSSNNKTKLNGVKVLTYNVIPMGKVFGCIQLITDCIPLRDILTLKSDVFSKKKLFDNLIATSAGSYIASMIMGVRDRHFDNILIRTTDCTLFHIDMNYVLGETITGLDANQFGITREFYDLLGKDNYNKFVELSCNAFLELRHHYRELINFACLAFSYIYDYNKIRRHVYKKLRMNETDKKSVSWLRKELKNAPFNTQTMLKNVVHKFATR